MTDMATSLNYSCTILWDPCLTPHLVSGQLSSTLDEGKDVSFLKCDDFDN